MFYHCTKNQLAVGAPSKRKCKLFCQRYVFPLGPSSAGGRVATISKTRAECHLPLHAAVLRGSLPRGARSADCQRMHPRGRINVAALRTRPLDTLRAGVEPLDAATVWSFAGT